MSVLILCLSERHLQSCMMKLEKKGHLVNFQYTHIILKTLIDLKDW